MVAAAAGAGGKGRSWFEAEVIHAVRVAHIVGCCRVRGRGSGWIVDTGGGGQEERVLR
jgi:hypothetical protein